MRLVSQDGRIDVPYEQASIEVNGNNIYCGYSSIITRHCTGRRFAEYSSKDKALKVMEMLREQYFNNNHEETYRDGVFDYAPNFKFPADEEVEA